MASHVFFNILVLLATVVSIVIVAVEGGKGACSVPLGACGPAGDCDRRCKAQHGDGEGSCDMNLCTCYYSCYTPTPPSPPERNCNTGLGLCTAQCMDDCCNSKCALGFKQGVGFCREIAPFNLCYCEYVCNS